MYVIINDEFSFCDDFVSTNTFDCNNSDFVLGEDFNTINFHYILPRHYREGLNDFYVCLYQKKT